MNKKEKIEDAILIIIVGIITAIMLCVWLSQEPNGYYKATETMQSDGSYYIWVENENENE